MHSLSETQHETNALKPKIHANHQNNQLKTKKTRMSVTFDEVFKIDNYCTRNCMSPEIFTKEVIPSFTTKQIDTIWCGDKKWITKGEYNTKCHQFCSGNDSKCYAHNTEEVCKLVLCTGGYN